MNQDQNDIAVKAYKEHDGYSLVEGHACVRLHQHNAAYPDGWVDTIVTSPPYNLGVDYGPDIDDSLPEGVYAGFTRWWLLEAKLALKESGSLFVNIGSSSKAPHRPFNLVATALELGLKLQNTFHWVKSITFEDKEGNEVSRGHFKPINSKRFVNDCHEYVFHFTLNGDVAIDRLAIGVPYQDKSNAKRWASAGGRDKRCRGNVWLIPYDTITSSEKQRSHPATFPVELARRCIALAAPGPDAMVVDPFVGSGTTGVAAQAMGIKNFLGIDLSREFLVAAGQRLFGEEATNA